MKGFGSLLWASLHEEVMTDAELDVAHGEIARIATYAFELADPQRYIRGCQLLHRTAALTRAVAESIRPTGQSRFDLTDENKDVMMTDYFDLRCPRRVLAGVAVAGVIAALPAAAIGGSIIAERGALVSAPDFGNCANSNSGYGNTGCGNSGNGNSGNGNSGNGNSGNGNSGNGNSGNGNSGNGWVWGSWLEGFGLGPFVN